LKTQSWFPGSQSPRADCIRPEVVYAENENRRTEARSACLRAANRLFDLRDALADHVLHGLRQWSVGQSVGFGLAVIEHPAEEVNERFALGRVSRVGRDQQPGKAGDRIGGCTGSVGDRNTEVGGHCLGRRGGSSGYTVGRSSDILAGGVLHRAVGHLVLNGVDQLDVAEGVRGLTNHTGDALVALLTDACGPLHGGALAYLAVPIGADLREVIGEDVGGSASVGAIDGQNRIGRKIDAGIVLGDARIVPRGDLAQVDVSDDVAREVEILIDTGDVVDRNDCAEDGRNVHRFNLGALNLLVIHGAVGGTEVDRTLGDLTDAAAGADGLIIDLDVGILLAVFAEPFGVDRVGEGRPCSVDVLCAGSNSCQCQYACCNEFHFHSFPLGNRRVLCTYIECAG